MGSPSRVTSDVHQKVSDVGAGFRPASTIARLRRRFRPRRLTKPELLWLAFITVQALDGAMSYIGVSLYGLAIEANPLVRWYLSVLGPAIGFTAAKLYAVTCGTVLHVTAHHRWVAVLTCVYVVFAVGPWFVILIGHL